ncbi:uncharacterized protein F5891DRAFT_1022066 [Suillus fuscotomentosus]|uniref:Uncharacterized protein n=1 Tax=Suillus fuscotomentosus TaxID=1912939 RepID=A0AAD4EAD9_9AGAM|nr:uncharacterized protein F5891DRAFT_1022066 [Suillus fuscotomentosus]KAG1902541.1 hypothetical protein F5891DRAFT_1022066 [Suillus fuscotomentosus]
MVVTSSYFLELYTVIPALAGYYLLTPNCLVIYCDCSLSGTFTNFVLCAMFIRIPRVIVQLPADM